MPQQFCDKGIFCPGSDFPIANFSAESPDNILFFSIEFGHNPPQLNYTFTSTGCVTECESAISQADADQCAQRQAILCGNGTQTHDGDHPITFENTPQSCTIYCPDGLPFTYFVPAGLYISSSQALADQQAHDFACQQAQLFKLCLGSLPRCTCVGSSYSGTIQSASRFNLVWSVVSGVMPPGLSLIPGGFTATVAGTPTTSGTYSFQVQAVTQFNTFMVKSFTITVIEITTTQLPAFSIGTPYSFQLQAAGGSGNYRWKIKSGSLPPGLTMDNSGLISGIPT